jgi:hypothetical protein
MKFILILANFYYLHIACYDMFGVLEIVTRLNDKSNLHARFLVILKNKIKKIKIKFVIQSK